MRKIKNLKVFKHQWLSILCMAAVLASCTDLEVEQQDSILQSDFSGVDPASTINGMINDTKGYFGDQANFYALAEVTSDFQLVPTRGGDWGDNGIWRQLQEHSWAPDHAYITAVWNQFNSLQLSASQVLSPLSKANAEQTGQASFFRALAMFVILDNFGQVPFRDITVSNNENPEVFTGATAVDFIVSDLNTAISNMSTVAAGAVTEKPSKAAAQFLLAKVLLNKHIYVGGTPASGDMNQVIQLVDQIAADGYALETGNYFDIFKATQDSETIYYIATGVGNRIWNGLHYNVNSPDNEGGGWNGFSVLADYYDLFEGDPNNNYVGAGQEDRRGWVPDASNANASNFGIGYGFLINQQYNEDGTPLKDRNGAPLIYGRDFVDGNGQPNLQQNSEITGIRNIKYHPANGGFTEHEVVFRYADAHLMKAEAILRGGTSTSTALGLVNELREARNNNGNTPAFTALTEQNLLDERGRELYAEFWRRNDLIRFDQYKRAWPFKVSGSVNNPNRAKFPIPASQLSLNPNLVQNPGY